MNSYFVENPDMIVGSMEMVSGPYGLESTCVADTSLPFEEQFGGCFLVRYPVNMKKLSWNYRKKVRWMK